MICAGSVVVGTAPFQEASGGSIPTSALQAIRIQPIPMLVARRLLAQKHYSRSFSGGTKLAFGAFLGTRLLGALTLGAGPFNAHSLVRGATPNDCLTLTRLWLSDELQTNSESRILGLAIRALKRHTNLKFLLTYADPAQGHLGTIYQATNWLYSGLSAAMPMYDLGDGKLRHSRSLAHGFGTHSVRYFTERGLPIQVVRQSPKHRYLYFLDRTWRERLLAPVLPYPKKDCHADY